MKEIIELRKIYRPKEIIEKTGIRADLLSLATKGRELQLSEPVRNVLELHRKSRKKILKAIEAEENAKT